MKAYTTNYTNTFILIAEDCPVHAGIPPLFRKIPSVAELQFNLLQENPYRFTSDEILFKVYALKNAVPEDGIAEEKQKFFSSSKACFRASPLPKKYGWGVHFDEEGKMALYGYESDDYRSLARNPQLKVVKAMRSKKAG